MWSKPLSVRICLWQNRCLFGKFSAGKPKIQTKEVFFMANDRPAVPLAAPYRHKIGKVTFQVSSFGDPLASETDQQLILRMLEQKVRRSSALDDRKEMCL
jgi:hypothetical protein